MCSGKQSLSVSAKAQFPHLRHQFIGFGLRDKPHCLVPGLLMVFICSLISPAQMGRGLGPHGCGYWYWKRIGFTGKTLWEILLKYTPDPEYGCLHSADHNMKLYTHTERKKATSPTRQTHYISSFQPPRPEAEPTPSPIFLIKTYLKTADIAVQPVSIRNRKVLSSHLLPRGSVRGLWQVGKPAEINLALLLRNDRLTLQQIL